MNERIEKLARECYQAPEFDYKKFAEMVVRECVTMLDHNGNYLIDDAATKQIKQYFGVEE